MKRFTKFGLKTLLAVLTLFAIWLAYRVTVMERIRRAEIEIQRDSIGLLTRKVDPSRQNEEHTLRPYWAQILLGQQQIDKIHGVWIRECDHPMKNLSTDVTEWDDHCITPLVIYMKDLPHLREVAIEGVPITSATIKEVAKLKNLQSLSITHTNVGDEALPYIVSLQKLEKLSIYGTKISPDGRESLKNELPNCEIH